MSSRLLVLSNGHGEDLIAQRVLQALRARQPNLEIQVLPLVGLGEAFSADTASCHLHRIGPQLQLPSGGFSNQSLRGLARDLGAGLPLLGLGAAFTYSRKLRKRLKTRKTLEVKGTIA